MARRCKRQRCEGLVLIYVMIAMMVVFTLGFVLLTLSSNLMTKATLRGEEERARILARSGIRMAMRDIDAGRHVTPGSELLRGRIPFADEQVGEFVVQLDPDGRTLRSTGRVGDVEKILVGRFERF